MKPRYPGMKSATIVWKRDTPPAETVRQYEDLAATLGVPLDKVTVRRYTRYIVTDLDQEGEVCRPTRPQG